MRCDSYPPINGQSLFALSFFALLSLCSCVTGSGFTDPYLVSEDRQRQNRYYLPPTANVPLIKNKNDFFGDVLYTSGSGFEGITSRMAYMPGKNWALAGSFYTVWSSQLSTSNKAHQAELSAGRVFRLSNGWHFENYVGAGVGTVKNTHYTGTSRINTSHVFMQPAFGWTDKFQLMQIGFASRVAWVHFDVTDTSFSTDRERFSAAQLNALYERPGHFRWEPAVVFRVGWQNVLFSSQVTYSRDLTDKEMHGPHLNFSLGMAFRFNTRKGYL